MNHPQPSMDKSNTRAHDNQFVVTPEGQRDESSLAPIVRTYEKIALDGSEVRLVCPHALASMNVPKANSFATVPTKQTHQLDTTTTRQRQLASCTEETKGNTRRQPCSYLASSETGNGGGYEQIRWFRNHVPLQRQLNYSPHGLRNGKGELNESKVSATKKSFRSKHQFAPAGVGSGGFDDVIDDVTETAPDGSSPCSGLHQKCDIVQATPSQLNQTAGLMQDGRGSDSNERSMDHREVHFHVTRHRLELQTEHATAIHHRTLAQANVNELSQDEQFAILNSQQPVIRADENNETAVREQGQDQGNEASSDKPEWYIGEFGELVLSRISRESAGSYTCLHDGQQSEVLLDVLSDENLGPVSAFVGSNGLNQKGIVRDVETKTRQTTPSGVHSSVESSLFETRLKVLQPSNGDDVSQFDPSSRSVSKGYKFEGGQVAMEPSSAAPLSAHPEMNRIKRLGEGNVIAANSNIESKSPVLVTRPTLEEEQEPMRTVERRHRRLVSTTTEVRPDKNLVALRQSLMTPFFFVETKSGRLDNIYHETIQRNDSKNELGGRTNSNVNLFQVTTNTAKKQPKWAHLSAIGYRPQSQPQLHLVESEIISSRDLESIPGLMYTKQQFYCPIMNQADLFGAIEDQINLLIENFCRPPKADQIKDELNLDCAKLVNRLIAQLIEIDEECTSDNDHDNEDKANNGRNDEQLSHNSNLCWRAGNLMDIIWYKDSSKLDFDSDGRGLDKKLNVKLIDFIDQFETASHGYDNKESEHSRRDQEKIDMFGGSREGKNSPLLTLRRRNGQQQQGRSKKRTQENHRHQRQQQHHNILCPPKGLILEIDGIRRLNAGRYTCALKFNKAKLRSRFRALKRLQRSRQLRDMGDKSITSSGSDWSVSKNDKSKCCDAEPEKRASLHLPWLAPEIDNVPEIRSTKTTISQMETIRNKDNENIEQASFARDSKRFRNDDLNSPIRPSGGVAATKTESDRISASHGGRELDQNRNNINMETSFVRDNEILVDDTEHPFASKQIKTLMSILNGSSISSEESWAYFEQTISNPQPPMVVQTFLLLITERPANSCSLWRTIREANDAYSRRKLTDFKRLKQSLMKPIDAAATNANVAADYDEDGDADELGHRRGAQERLENLNDSNGARRIGQYHAKSGDCEQSDTPKDRDDDDENGRRKAIATPIHSNGKWDDAGGKLGASIDGKLVASLSWLNGAAESDAGAIVDVRRERRNDDIDNARSERETSGQQNLFSPNEDDNGGGGGLGSQKKVHTGAVEVHLDRRHLATNGIRHRAGGSFPLSSLDTLTNGSLEFQAIERERFTLAAERTGDGLGGGGGTVGGGDRNESNGLAGANSWNAKDKADQSTRLTNNLSKQTTTTTTTTTSSDAGVGIDWRRAPRTSAEDNILENARNPFNYANERNLNPYLNLLGALKSSARRLERQQQQQQRQGKRARTTAVESFDLHPKTFDPGQTEGRSTVAGGGGSSLQPETKSPVVDTPVFGGPRWDEIALDHQSQGTDMEPKSDGADGSKRLVGSDGYLQRRCAASRDDAAQLRANSPNQAPFLIDSPDGRVNALAENVIDGKRKTTRADDQYQDQEDSRESDEVPNEVSNLKQNGQGGARAGSGQLEGDKLSDSLDGSQTNSSSSSSSLPPPPSSRLPISAHPQPFDRISASGFVTEKSNIRIGARALVRRGRAKFNNIGAVPERTTRTTKAAANERLDSDNLINFSQAHKAHQERLRRRRRRQQQRGRRWRRRSQRPLDNQSDRRRRRTPAVTSRDIGWTHDNDDALSIGHAANRQPYESEPESGHKLQPSELTEQRRRFSRSDKSVWSGDVSSDPLRRHHQLAPTGDGQSENESPSSGGEKTVTVVAALGWASSVASRGIQYDSNANQDDDDEFSSLTKTTTTATTTATAEPGGLMVLQDEIVTSPGTQKPVVFLVPNGQTSSITSTDDNVDSSISKKDGVSNDDEVDGYSIKNYSTNSPVSNSENDESLLWIASQYLYMHMRAFAASSIYGVQVDVEWSNENEWMMTELNRTATNGNELAGPILNHRVDGVNVSEFVEKRSDFTNGATNPKAPIATIELVSGQDLHLECTAQALGRLPEVNWYKRIAGIPGHISGHMGKQLARLIGDDIFWPVTSLDLLDDGKSSKFARNFVCSQSMTIFDNLLNQTFTVVNSLKLSERTNQNDAGLALATSSQVGVGVGPIEDRRHNLYACMVTADVRREYATLGVNIRHASSKLPPGLSKRLRARSMSELSPDSLVKNGKRRVQPQIIDVDVGLQREEPSYNFLRQNQLAVPFRGVWVPIRKNGTHLNGYGDDGLSSSIYTTNPKYYITPIMLSLVIASLASLLVALVYLTTRSYRTLTNFHAEEECLDCTNRQHLPEEQLECLHGAMDEHFTTMPIKPATSYFKFDSEKMLFVHKLKRLDDKVDEEEILSLDTPQIQIPSKGAVQPDNFKPKAGDKISNKADAHSSLYYEAHFHHSDARFICDEIPTSLLDGMMSTEIRNELDYTFINSCERGQSCCADGRAEVQSIIGQTDRSL